MESVRGCPSCAEFEDDRLPPCPLACMSEKCKAKRKPVINVHHKPVIWILGGPGCGKGTQCSLMVKKYGFTHLSTGDLLRAEIRAGSERAKCLQNIVSRGGLVPNEIVLNIVRDTMMELESVSKGFIIDGYPREEFQGPAFEKAVSPVSLILYFKLSPESMLKRLQYRAATATVSRCDDDDDVFKHRIDTFLYHNERILRQYEDRVHTINAECSVEEIFADVQQYLDPLMDQAIHAFAAHQAAIEKHAAALAAAPPQKPMPVTPSAFVLNKVDKAT